MKTAIRISLLFATLFVLVPSIEAQSNTDSHSQSIPQKFDGVWHGEMDGLPAVDIGISSEGGEFTGAIQFYLHIRQDTKSPWTSQSRPPGPMFNMKLDGTTLHFRVSHKGAHPPESLNDPPVAFRLTLTGPDTAVLVNESVGGPGLLLKRNGYQR